ncbi:conserved hypothetical protein, partial [Ricinus communis]
MGEAFQRRRRFQQDALTHQAARRHHLDHGNGQGQSAGTGDDQHRHRIHQGDLPFRPHQEEPAQERQQRRQMDHRGIIAGDPIGQHHIAGASLLGQFHQPHDLGQQGIAAHRAYGDPDRRRQVQRAREHFGSRLDPIGNGLAGDQTGVHVRAALGHRTVGADPLAGGDAQHLARPQILGLDQTAGAVVLDHRDHARVQGQQMHDRLTGLAARPRIQIAPDQQEEQQHRRRIEIGVPSPADGFIKAHPRGQHDADGDGDVHVGPAQAQNRQGRAQERTNAIGDGGQADQGRQPMHEGPGRGPHVGPGPDRHREQHDVGGGEARHRHGPQQLVLFRLGLVVQALRVERHQVIA